jgi:hypothetical protein
MTMASKRMNEATNTKPFIALTTETIRLSQVGV